MFTRRLSPGFDFGNDAVDRFIYEKLIPLGCVVATSSPELMQESHCVNYAKLSNQRVFGALAELRDRLNLHTHFVTSGTKPKSDTTLHPKPERVCAFRNSLSSQVQKKSALAIEASAR